VIVLYPYLIIIQLIDIDSMTMYELVELVLLQSMMILMISMINANMIKVPRDKMNVENEMFDV
jgi:hypothetical protein